MRGQFELAGPRWPVEWHLAGTGGGGPRRTGSCGSMNICRPAAAGSPRRSASGMVSSCSATNLVTSLGAVRRHSSCCTHRLRPSEAAAQTRLPAITSSRACSPPGLGSALGRGLLRESRRCLLSRPSQAGPLSRHCHPRQWARMACRAPSGMCGRGRPDRCSRTPGPRVVNAEERPMPGAIPVIFRGEVIAVVRQTGQQRRPRHDLVGDRDTARLQFGPRPPVRPLPLAE
jgi:hypothetical protein